MISLQDKLEEAQARESRLVTRMEAIEEKVQVRESKLVARLEAMEKKMAGMAKSGLDIGKGSENDEVKGAKEKFPKKGKELSSKSKGILAMVEDSKSEVSESDEEEKGKNITGNKKRTRKGRGVRKEELKKNESASSSSSSEGLSEVEEKEAKTMFLREVPRIEKFNLGKGRDVNEFFDDYERYCRQKYGENENVWMKQLGEFLDGRLKMCYRSMCEGEPGYESVKARVIKQMKRMKGSVVYKKDDRFEEAKMKPGEEVGLYAHRLEALARRKYGEEGIEENKHLIRKFLATIPERIRVILNEKEKDRKRWSGKRLDWEDVLEILEDMRVNEDEVKKMYAGTEIVNGRTYKDALVSEELSVMRAFLEECKKDQIERGRNNVQVNVGSKANGECFGCGKEGM
ncbi:uncharacterized protein [Macrobrachium rosenbergii]|uniref:uncharacterized protein n=1 Tax=Macrobrachium rosenbergii TaxID=79674 RepID=UPI0034D3AF2A